MGGRAGIEARIAGLYDPEDGDGFFESERERRSVARRGSSSTYGELTFAGAKALFAHLRLGPEDCLFDLGSGTGKLVWQAALSTRVGRAVGVELVPSRHAIAEHALARARAKGWRALERVEFLHGDMLRADLSAATVVYSCNTAFPDRMLNRQLRKLATGRAGLRFVSLMPMDDNPWFEERSLLRLDTSWRKAARVRVYELVRPRKQGRGSPSR